jgi:hypothetical protein
MTEFSDQAKGDEMDFGVCNDCADIQIARSQHRQEWDAYHDEPCPEVELIPLPAASEKTTHIEKENQK